MSKMSDSECQFNSNKHHRRSSILKPAKVVNNRAPLLELGAASSDDTTTIGSKKRVSFHVINIKEYSTHAQTQEVQTGPAYNEFLSSMSDSSRNNTNNECSSFSPMVPAYVIPQDEDKENQINYEDNIDSFAEEDSSELCEENLSGQYNEPFDLSTKSKHEESKNFLESTKLSHCNTIMTTCNISGIQNLEETSIQDLDESDNSSFQRLIDQQPPAVNLFHYQESRKSMSRKSLSANCETEQEEPVLNLFQSQQNSRKSVSRKSFSAVSANQEQENVCQYQHESRKSLSRKSLSAHHDTEPENINDSIELTCHVPVNTVPSALDESSTMEMTTALPRRKSLAPRKSVNIKCTQDDSQSDEMEFTSAFPPMTCKNADQDESQFDESAMEVTGVFPTAFEPVKHKEINSPTSQDARKSLSNKTVHTKSMELSSNSLSESRQPSESCNPEKFSHNASSIDMVSMSEKSSRKSVSENVFKNIENLDESGMEMTEAFNVIPPNLSTDYASNEVSMSDSISDMDISNQSPPNATNAAQSMLADKTNFVNTSSVDFTIKTSFGDNIGRKSMVVMNTWELNDAPSNIDPLRNLISNSNAVHHKSFSGFENSALNPNAVMHRKSAPHAMVFSRDAIPSLDQNNHQPHEPVDKSGFEFNVSSRKSLPQTNSCSLSQSTMSDQHDKSAISVNSQPSNNSNLPLNESVHDQSKFTQDFTSFTTAQLNPMAHSTNLNISLEPKNLSLLNTSRETSMAHENNAQSLNQAASEECKTSANLTIVEQSEPINTSNHEDSMELSCAIALNEKPAFNEVDNSRMEMSSVAPQANMSESKTTPEKEIVQPQSKPNKENSILSITNISVMQMESILAITACENMGKTIHSTGVTSIEETIAANNINETFERDNLPTHEKTVPDVYNMSVDCSTLISPGKSVGAAVSSNTVETIKSDDNDVPKVMVNSETSDETVETAQLPGITHTNELPRETSNLNKNESQKYLQVSTDNDTSGHKNVTLDPSHISTDDGFSSTRDSHQSIESGISPLKSAQVSIVNSDGERSRKRPSDGFETHGETLVQCEDSNYVIIANPKKRSKTFEVEAFQESREVEASLSEKINNNVHSETSASNKTTLVDINGEKSTAITTNETPVVSTTPSKTTMVVATPSKTSAVAATPSKTPVVAATPSKTSALAETPSKTPVVAATPSKTPVVAVTPSKLPAVAPTPSKTPEVSATPSKTPVIAQTRSKTPVVAATSSKTPVVAPIPTIAPEVSATPSKTPCVAGDLHKTPLVSSTPRKTPVVAATPSKTPSVAPSCKTPMFVTPIKPPILATPCKELTFVTPGKAKEGSDTSRDSIDSINLSTYPNPSSTLTDSIINNITDIMGLPLIGSVRKHSASEVKAKQASSCSTPLLPNSCSKTMIVDRFFQSIDNRGKQPENFVVPSKNIIKKLDLTREGNKQDSPDEHGINSSSSTDTNSPPESSVTYENTPVGSSAEAIMTLKRTKDQLNISRNNDPNSSNYIPEKQQRNTSVNIMNTSQHSTIESVVNEISLLDISTDFEKIDHVQSALATTLNITDVPDRSMREHASLSLNETGTAPNIEAPSDGNNKFTAPVETKQNSEVVKEKEESNPTQELKDTEVVKVIESNPTEILKSPEVVNKIHSRAAEEKRQDPIKEVMKNSPKSPTTHPESQSVVEKLDQTNNAENSKPTESLKPKNHESECSDQSPVERANFMKKRKSRLSIVPKQSPIKAVPYQNDTKRKTLKIQPKKSTMVFESLENSVEEVQDYAEQNMLMEEKRGSHEWKLRTLELNLWEFEFLHGLIILKVEFNKQEKKSRKDKAVKNICFETCDATTELRALCFKILHSRYTRLSNMCSSSSDVIPLLQHISPFMSYLREFARSMKICEVKYGMRLQGTKVLVDITSYSKKEWSQVSLDLKDIDFITPNDIHVKNMFGNLTESEVRKQFPVFATRDNADFIKTFIEKIYILLDTK